MANTIDRKKVGRKPGTPNKVTKGIKDNILDVFEKIGGVQNFAIWATDNQTEFYKHYTKLLPTEVNAKLDGNMQITHIVHTIIDATDSQDTKSI